VVRIYTTAAGRSARQKVDALLSSHSPTGRPSAIAKLRQRLIDGNISDDSYEMRAAERIHAWAKANHQIGDYVADAAEPLARQLMDEQGWSLNYIAEQSLQDLVVLLDDRELIQARPLPNWTEEDIAKWEANKPRLKYQLQGLELHMKHAATTYKDEWDRRIGTEFPGISLDGLMKVASWAGIEYDALAGMNAWDIYQTAMTMLEQKGLGKPDRDSDELSSESHDPDSAIIDDLVTLDQVAPLTGLSKRTLERYLREGKLPDPDIRGGGGKSNKWFWGAFRVPLSKIASRTLPVKFPGSRIV
jgi:hypothetical protein